MERCRSVVRCASSTLRHLASWRMDALSCCSPSPPWRPPCVDPGLVRTQSVALVHQKRHALGLVSGWGDGKGGYAGRRRKTTVPISFFGQKGEGYKKVSARNTVRAEGG